MTILFELHLMKLHKAKVTKFGNNIRITEKFVKVRIAVSRFLNTSSKSGNDWCETRHNLVLLALLCSKLTKALVCYYHHSSLLFGHLWFLQ